MRPLILCLLLAACASSEPSKMRPMSELPERHREVWNTWLAEDSAAWREVRPEVQADPDLAGFVADNLIRTWLQAYGERDFTDLTANRLGKFERARTELILLKEASLPRLVELLAVGNGEASELAGELLLEMGRDAVPPVAALLERPEERARQRAARLLGRLPMLKPSEEEPLRQRVCETLAEDEDWLTRAMAAQALAQRGCRDRTTREARVALAAALKDPDPAVHVRAAEGLGQLEDPSCVPNLIFYLESCQTEALPAGVMAAQKSLTRLLGQDQAASSIGEWRRLWKEHRQGRKR